MIVSDKPFSGTVTQVNKGAVNAEVRGFDASAAMLATAVTAGMTSSTV